MAVGEDGCPGGVLAHAPRLAVPQDSPHHSEAVTALDQNAARRRLVFVFLRQLLDQGLLKLRTELRV